MKDSQPRGIVLAEIKACIVDLDGTLVDTVGDFTAALNAMLADLALPSVGAADVSLRVGKGSEHLIRSVLALVLADPARGAQATEQMAKPIAKPIAEELYAEAFDRYQSHYRRINGLYSQVYPGALEAMQALQQQGKKLACLTNKPRAFAHALLQSKGLLPFFDWVFGADSFERKKPDPLPVLRTCAALGSDPKQSLMIGDSINDCAAGSGAGCPVLLVRYGYNHGQAVDGLGAQDCTDHLADWVRAQP